MTIWADPVRKLCFFCIVGGYHFYHNPGGQVNTDPMTKADPRCTLCLEGEIHFNHNDKAFRTIGNR